MCTLKRVCSATNQYQRSVCGPHSLRLFVPPNLIRPGDASTRWRRLKCLDGKWAQVGLMVVTDLGHPFSGQDRFGPDSFRPDRFRPKPLDDDTKKHEQKNTIHKKTTCEKHTHILTHRCAHTRAPTHAHGRPYMHPREHGHTPTPADGHKHNCFNFYFCFFFSNKICDC